MAKPAETTLVCYVTFVVPRDMDTSMPTLVNLMCLIT